VIEFFCYKTDESFHFVIARSCEVRGKAISSSFLIILL
jgi:hypothetical protein